MYLSDEETNYLYCKEDVKSTGTNGNNIDKPKKPLCHFFIPRSVTKLDNIRYDLDNNIYGNSRISSQNVCPDSFSEDQNKAEPLKDQTKDPVVLTKCNNDSTSMPNRISVVVIPMESSSEDNNRSVSYKSTNSSTESFSSFPPISNSRATKLISDPQIIAEKDIEQSFSEKESGELVCNDSKNSRSEQQNPSSSINPDGDFTTDCRSILEKNDEKIITSKLSLSCDNWDCMSRSSGHSLQVDLDSIQSSKNRGTNDRKRKGDDNTEKSSSIKSSKKSKSSRSDLRQLVVLRETETDEETEKAFGIEDSLSILPSHRSQKERKLSMANNLIFCFSCNIDSTELCNKHPPETIFNLNIDCPFIEYMPDKTYDKYTDTKTGVHFCCCNQCEVDHIEESLPNRFQIRQHDSSTVSIVSRTKIVPGTIIGPYLGEIIELCELKQLTSNLYKVRNNSTTVYCCSDVEFAFKSNWLRCVCFTTNHSEANLKVIHYDRKVFFQAMMDIEENQELLLLTNIEFNSNQEITKQQTDIAIYRGDNRESQLSKVDQDLEKIPFIGTKYRKEMIVDIAKLWRQKPLLTINETLQIISEKYPDARSLSERYLSKLSTKYHLRHWGGANHKLDHERQEFVRKLLVKSPDMPVLVIGEKLQKKYPNHAMIDYDMLAKIIRYQGLRPESSTQQLSIETTEADKQLCIRGRRKKWKRGSGPATRAICKAQNLTLATIASNSKIVTEKSKKKILKTKLSEQKMERFHSDYFDRRYLPNVGKLFKKIDREMEIAICDIRRQFPHYSAANINRHLRRLLPDKPQVEPNALYRVLKKYNLPTKYNI